MEWSEVVSFWNVCASFWRDKEIGALLILGSAAALYFRGHVKSEKLITHIVDVRTTDEMNALREKISNMLRVIESILYTGVEKYVYENHGGHDRRIMVVRKSKPVDIKARDYLSEYHDALHKCVIDAAPEIIMNEILVHRVAETPVDEEQECTSAESLRHLVCYDIAGHAGKNSEVKAIENMLLPIVDVHKMYKELCCAARNLRAIKNEAIETEIREHRIPFMPSVYKLINGRKKALKTQKR